MEERRFWEKYSFLWDKIFLLLTITDKVATKNNGRIVHEGKVDSLTNIFFDFSLKISERAESLAKTRKDKKKYIK